MECSVFADVPVNTSVMPFIQWANAANGMYPLTHTEGDPSASTHFINMIFVSVKAHKLSHKLYSWHTVGVRGLHRVGKVVFKKADSKHIFTWFVKMEP